MKNIALIILAISLFSCSNQKTKTAKSKSNVTQYTKTDRFYVNQWQKKTKVSTYKIYYKYDIKGKKTETDISVNNEFDAKTHYFYNKKGKLIKRQKIHIATKNSILLTEYLAYNKKNQVIRQIWGKRLSNPDTAKVFKTYDKNGNIKECKIKELQYNGWHQFRFSYQYDERNNLLEYGVYHSKPDAPEILIEQKNYSYNSSNDVTEKIKQYPDRSTIKTKTTYQYDANRNLVNINHIYQQDTLSYKNEYIEKGNKQIIKTYENSIYVGKAETTYDLNGNIVKIVKYNGDEELESIYVMYYDDKGRLRNKNIYTLPNEYLISNEYLFSNYSGYKNDRIPIKNGLANNGKEVVFYYDGMFTDRLDVFAFYGNTFE